MTDLHRGFIALIKAALTEQVPVLPEGLSYREVYALAETQQLVPMIYYGALMDPAFFALPEAAWFMESACSLISLSANQQDTIETLFAAFEEAGIAYMPLKGTLLKSMYPAPEMRLMGDADILIRLDQYERIAEIMRSLGYTYLKESNHEYNWVSESIMIVELHKRLIPSNNEDYFAYYGDGWRLAHPVEGCNGRHEMSPEDTYVYLFTHYAKHFRDQGAGLKYILDFYLYRNHYPELDMAYVKREMRKLHLWTFHENLMHLLRVWFEDEAADEMSDHLTARILDAGVFGKTELGALSEGLRVAKATGSVKSAQRAQRWRLLFPSYANMCIRFPILVKWAILLPLMWIVRWFDVLFNHRDHYRFSMDRMEKMSDENLERYLRELNYVGLDYHFDDLPEAVGEQPDRSDGEPAEDDGVGEP